MSQVIRHSEDKVRPPSEPRPALVHVGRLRSRAIAWFVLPVIARRIARTARANVDAPKRWRRRLIARIGYYLAALGVVILLFRLGLALYGVVQHRPTPVETYCTATHGACDVLFGFLTPFLAIALATFIFLAWRLWWVTRPVFRKARSRARELVPTAGAIIQKIVGRDELCTVIMQVLRDRDNRRPYLIVGGVGTGKTAVLVRLTELLAPRHALPVPIRLREVDKEFDFGELAQQRFCDEVSNGVFPVAFAERVWQQLRKDDRVVVLADGLEEAFAGTVNERNRDNLIRQAIQQAYQQKLPLVIASRPHQPLESTQAAIMELEPLSEEAALDYVEENRVAHDEQRLDWIVETADVTDSPLYLQITRELYDAGLLEHLTGGSGSQRLDTRGGDRSAIRWRLLEMWKTALISGHLYPEVIIRGKDRKGAIDFVSALACVGLLMDKIEVSFEDLMGTDRDSQALGAGAQPPQDGCGKRHRPGYPAIREALAKRTDPSAVPDPAWEAGRHHYKSVLSLAASRCEELGLVEMKGDGVRFQHSIVQAYLGSEFLGALDPDVLRAALNEPGRELLIAMVLDSRRIIPGRGALAGNAHLTHYEARQQRHVSALLEAARQHHDAKAFDLYAAALEIDSVQKQPQHADIAESLEERWCAITIGDRRTLEEAKLGVVRRFGEGIREIERRNCGTPAYERIFKIACKEDSYPLRIAIAQEIGAGGDRAFGAICKGHSDPWDEYQSRMKEMEVKDRARAEANETEYKRLRARGHPESATERERREEKAHDIYEKAAENRHMERESLWREFIMYAWLAPLLLGSAGDEYRDAARAYLDLWLKHVPRRISAQGDTTLPVSMEIALAQGFKSAANRRKLHPSTFAEARSLLLERAEQMLQESHFWYTHLTLIHALCLWSLPDDSGPAAAAHAGDLRPQPERQSSTGNRRLPVPPTRGPVETVAHWLSIAGTKHASGDHDVDHVSRGRELEHPFVAEAADLAALALQSGHPERFIWIDESGVMNKVGSRPARPEDYRKHNLWIPPSTGWSALSRRAQQLLADVLIILNLTEGSGEPEILEQRLKRADRNDLPLCLTANREPLRPGTTIGMPGMSEPQSTCVNGCPFELCPYPPSGALARAELSEPFCRRQKTLLGRRFPRPTRKTAPWQGITPKDLSSFWEKMASRTRPHDPEST